MTHARKQRHDDRQRNPSRYRESVPNVDWGLYYDGAYSPTGEIVAESGTADRNFTGQNADLNPDLYDFLFRELRPGHGRWVSPDPEGVAAVDPTDPQSWNRYAYVGNRPMGLVDPLGLNAEKPTCYLEGMEVDCRFVLGMLEGGSGWIAGSTRQNLYWMQLSTGRWQLSDDSDVFPKQLFFGPESLEWADALQRLRSTLSQNGLVDDARRAAPRSVVARTAQPSDYHISALPIPTTPAKRSTSFGVCFSGKVVEGFFGTANLSGATVAVNVAPYVVKRGLGSLLPGPGWLYTAVAVTFDAGVVLKAYTDCTY